MEQRASLAVAGLVVGALAGVVIGLALVLVEASPATTAGWATLVVGTALAVALSATGLVAWSTRGPAEARRALAERLAEGNLVDLPAGDRELLQLALTLRRALFQVQRVTSSLHRTARDLQGQAGSLLDAARRQGAAAERSRTAVGAMSESLESSQARVGQLDAFARKTGEGLTDLGESMEEVARAAALLSRLSGKTVARAEAMNQRLAMVAEAGQSMSQLNSRTQEAVSDAERVIDAVRRRTEETGTLAVQMTARAAQGAALVHDALVGLKRIDESVQRAADLVQALGTKSLEIGRVIDVIQEIADQTNLLALNAAIIASQAGESGKAFAVVATEVRNLSEKTRRSTMEISGQVKGVREGVKGAVELVTRSRDEAAAGVHLGERAADALAAIQATAGRALAAVEAVQTDSVRLEQQGDTLNAVSDQLTARILEVTGLAAEQAREGRELARQVSEMARTATEVTTRADQQVGVGRDLVGSVSRLNQAVEDISAAQVVLKRGDAAISEEVLGVREDARRVVSISDELTRTVAQLAHEADTLDAEVFRFKLPRPRVGGTLKVGVHRAVSLADGRGLDPAHALDLQVSEVLAALYSTLLRYEDGRLAPDLAEAWEADGSGRRYRLTLKQGVSFSDGVPLTAAHVKASFERLLARETGSVDARFFQDLAGFPGFTRGAEPHVAGIEVLDEGTIQFRLEEPRAFFLSLLALPSTAVTRRHGDALLGTGPFKVGTLLKDQIVLERNGAYQPSGLPLLGAVQFLLFSSRRASLEAFRNGEVDLVSYLHAENLVEAGVDVGSSLSVATPSVWFLGFHVGRPPFDDARVRRAIRAGLDVRSLVDLFHPGARVARSLTPPSLLETERVHEPRTDLALARRLFAEVGLSRLTLQLQYAPDRDTRDEDRVLFRPLLDAGLVELEHVAVNDFWAKVREGRLAVFRGNWIADVADPDNFLHLLLNSRAQTYYQLGYQSPAFDALTDQARSTADRGIREQLYRRAEALVREDCVLVPLFHDRFHAVASARLQGIRLHQTPPQVRFEELWLTGDS